MKWFCLDTNGDIQFLGHFDDDPMKWGFDFAEDRVAELKIQAVWIFDEETARNWIHVFKENL